MADKKEKPKEKPTGWDFGLIEGIILVLLFATLFMTIIPAMWNYVISGDFSFYGFRLSGIVNFFKNNVQFFRSLGFIFAGIGMIGTFIFNKKADAVWREEKAKLYPENMSVSTDTEPIKNVLTEKWQKIMKLSESENQSDWRWAIIEADIILDELLQKLQLPGDTMGEKLKAVEKSDFNTIESAWEAHKARNMVAHNGSDFLINQKQIRHIISLYEAVFKEFFLI